MPREEQDREDLLREATAMVERAEIRVGFWPEPVFVGFRRNGSLSVYFGGDPVYQFNASVELRRANIGGLLYKAEHRRLISLHRERTENATLLVRHDLSDAESNAILLRMNELLVELSRAINRGTSGQAAGDTLGIELLGEVPAAAGVLARAHAWLDQHNGKIKIANSPRAGQG